MKIAVTTPTGQIGHRIVQHLIEADAQVTVLVRDAAKLPAEVRDRVDVRQGTLEDAEFVTSATAGADVLFLLVPPNFGAEDWGAWMLGIGRNAADAVRRNGMGRVVLLSSIGAHRDDVGPVSRLGEIERLLQSVAPDVVALRAGYFMENLLSAVPAIRHEGALYQVFSAETLIPLVATRDLAAVSARWLLDPSWSGHQTRVVSGPEDLTMPAAAEIISAAVGRPVRHVVIPPEAIQEAFLGMGASPSVAAEYAQMMRGFVSSGYEIVPAEGAIRGTTSLAEWTREALRPALDPGPELAAR